MNDGDKEKTGKSCEITGSTHAEYARVMRTPIELVIVRVPR